MSLAEVQHQEPAVTALAAALRSDHLAHAWLFTGPEGVGREKAAVGLAQALVCPKAPGVGCGVCAVCARVGSRNHPDVIWVMSEDEQVRRKVAGKGDFDGKASRDIRVDQIRKLQDRLSLKALEGKRKVAILVGAHALNAQAQNALLKTLEEPPAGTVLVLITSAPDKLLPTIRSRCTRAAFRPLPTAFIAERLLALVKGLDPATAHTMAVMAGGSLERAQALDAKGLAERRDTIARFEALSPADARGWLQLAEALAEDRPTAEAGLDVLQVWLRDVAVAQVGGVDLANADLAPLAAEAARKVTPAGLMRRAALLDEARNAISQRNGGPRLQLERLFIEMFVR
jgi:DNA polymerase-3 subunit delta'